MATESLTLAPRRTPFPVRRVRRLSALILTVFLTVFLAVFLAVFLGLSGLGVTRSLGEIATPSPSALQGATESRATESRASIAGDLSAGGSTPVVPIRPRATLQRLAPPPAAQYPYKGLIAEMAAKYDLSPELVAGVVYIESNFDKNSVSYAGAIGLMQLMPATARPLAKRLGLSRVDLTDPRTNLELGCYYLRILLDQYDGHLPTALSFYNGGRWGIVSRGVYRNRRYIRKVMDSYWRYAQPVSNGFTTARR